MENMKDVLKEDKLEELLVANWTKFLNSSKLMAFALQNARDRLQSFAIIPSTDVRNKGVQVTLSRFQIVPTGFILWVEFNVPIETDSVAVGTTELHLSNTGDIKHIQTLGNLYRKDSNNV
jgi:hypothetical protein